MKRYIIPAFFVVDVKDDSSANLAESIACVMKEAANRHEKSVFPGGHGYLLLDEELPNKEVQIHPEETELPHTYKES